MERIANAQVVRFGDFEVNLRSGELRRNGLKIKLGDQSFHVLTMLLENAGEVVTREELRQRLWTEDTFVDFEAGLNSAIKRLRDALSDSAENPRYVETLPKRGYRFNAAVENIPLEPAQGIESIAVLPLENLTGDSTQDYFVDGMTDALITRLAQIAALRVISRTSVMRYKDLRAPLPEIARRLRVDAVVEGTVTRSGERVRITAQLIDAAHDRHLWASQYERDLTDILFLQAEVARAIAEEIQVKLTPQEQSRLASGRLVKPAAYEAYLRGRLHWNKRTEEGMRKGLELFQRAREEDPSYALSHAGVAESYNMMGFWGVAAPHEVSPRAKEAAAKALEIDGNLAEGHAALSWARFAYDWDWVGAEQSVRRAIELNPGYATAHQWYSHLLVYQGRVTEALAEVQRTVELDPLSLIMNSSGAYVHILAHRFEEARERVQNALELETNFAPSHLFLGRVHEETGQFEEACDEFSKAVAISGGAARYLSGLGHGYAVAGKPAEARKILVQLQEMAEQRFVPAYDFAVVHAGLGTTEDVFRWLEKAYEERSTWLAMVKADSRFDPFHSDARFPALLRRMGLA